MRSRRLSGKSAHGFLKAASVPHHLGEVMAAREALVEDDESTIAALAAKAAAKKAAAKERKLAAAAAKAAEKAAREERKLAAAAAKAVGDAIRQTVELRQRQQAKHGGKKRDKVLEALGNHLASRRVVATVLAAADQMVHVSGQRLRHERQKSTKLSDDGRNRFLKRLGIG